MFIIIRKVKVMDAIRKHINHIKARVPPPLNSLSPSQNHFCIGFCVECLITRSRLNPLFIFKFHFLCFNLEHHEALSKVFCFSQFINILLFTKKCWNGPIFCIYFNKIKKYIFNICWRVCIYNNLSNDTKTLIFGSKLMEKLRVVI